jgi:hypothetical protein
MQKISFDRVERHATHTALVMILLLCAMSMMNGTGGILTTARNLLLLVVGTGGLMTFAELEQFRKMRISKKRKRILFYAQVLLLAFSLIFLVFAMLQLDLISSLKRWD